jgi:anti-anti-sigma regulatory factor
MTLALPGAISSPLHDDGEATILIELHNEPEVLILKMHEVIGMDSSALHKPKHLHNKLQKRGKHLILCGPLKPYAA